MIRIAIFDDDEQFALHLETLIIEYAKKQNVAVDTLVFCKEDDMYRNIKEDGIYDLLFLDIELGSVTGVEIGKRLRADIKNEAMQIVFVSAKESYAMQLFDIRPMNFLVKPIDYDKVKYIMDEYNRLFEFQPHFFEYNIGRQRYKINEQTIIYFESHGKKIKMVTQDEEIEFYGKLSDVLKKINLKLFCEVHKSYVINLVYTLGYTSNYVEMVNHAKIPISRSMRSNLNRKIMENVWDKTTDEYTRTNSQCDI